MSKCARCSGPTGALNPVAGFGTLCPRCVLQGAAAVGAKSADDGLDADILFGRLVVEQGIARREQVQECLRLQGQLASTGVRPLPRLGELLVRKGYLSAEDFGRTLRGLQAAELTRSQMTDLPGEAAEAAKDEANRFGRYVRVTRLGAGGMGEVWKAWDAELRRWVALKFLKHEDAEDLARFKREAQTAAKLNHPNIGAIHEVGEFGGKNFIAMQFVEGQTLGTFPRDDRKALVELVRDAALALHAAHEHGIVHRDIKPENLMVEGTPKPRSKTTRRAPGRSRASGLRVYVLDFGLARPMKTDSSLSQSGLIVGTPAYMSPEQARGKIHDLDARTDVYSLGVTLYELLADRVPFRDRDVYELLRRIVEEDPKPARRVNPKIDRDLETIVMKCLEKDPARRYESAAALAEDLTRWLDGEAIAAHSPSAAYRLKKFFLKRKPLAAVVLLVIAASLVLVGYIWTLRSEARGLERDARARADAGDYEGAKQLLDQARPRIQIDEDLYHKCEAVLAERRRLSEEKIKEDSILGPILKRIEQLPATQEGMRRGLKLLADEWLAIDGFWNAWMTKAMLCERLNQHVEAIEAYRRAYTLNQKLGAAYYRRGKILMDAMNQNDQALVEFGKAQEVEQNNEYAVIARARIAMLRGDHSTALALCDEIESIGSHVSDLSFVRGCVFADRNGPLHDPDRAIAEFSKVIEIDARNAYAYTNRGYARVAKGDFDGAVADCATAIEIDPRYAMAYNNRGAILCDRLSRFDEAITDFTKAIEIDPKDASAYFNRGNAHQEKGDLDDAIADYSKAIDLDPKSAKGYFNRGNAHQAKGDLDGAIADFTKAIEINPRHAMAYNNRGNAKRDKGDLDGAIVDYSKAIDIDPRDAKAYFSRGTARQDKGDLDGAIADFTSAIEINPKLAEAYVNRGIARRAKGDLDGAIADFTSAIEINPKLAEAYANRGVARQAKGDFTGAILDLEKAIEVAPPEWPYQKHVEQALSELKNK